MKNRHISYVLGALIALGGLALSLSAWETEPQASKVAASAFELKMRILEGVREGPATPAKPVTSSFLKFFNFINFEAEEDIAVEQQLRKVYSLKDARLLTETRLVWEKGKSERAFHMFRLNGRKVECRQEPNTSSLHKAFDDRRIPEYMSNFG